MPSMDAFREQWSQVELDLVSGFHPDPVGLLGENRADLVIVSHAGKRTGVVFHPLFSYQVLAVTKVQSDCDLRFIPSGCVIHKASSLPTPSMARRPSLPSRLLSMAGLQASH
jgi:DNA-binding transcriptional LysR family regulator